MNIFDVEYTLNSKDNTDYILLSDMHGSFNLELANYINKQPAKYIVISGDLLNGQEWELKKKVEELRSFLGVISQNHKVIISLGNHDLWNLNINGIRNFYSLENIDNVYTIYNDSYIIDNNRFTSFVPSLELYSYKKQDDKKTIDKIIDQYQNKYSVSEDSKYIEHLVSHNPAHFNHKEIKDEISSKYDVIETGHFHDGWIPTKLLQKNIVNI